VGEKIRIAYSEAHGSWFSLNFPPRGNRDGDDLKDIKREGNKRKILT
jgi:hypothetical protein